MNKMTSKENGKVYDLRHMLNWTPQQLEAANIPADVKAVAARMIARERRAEASGCVFYGRIVRTTAKAVLFAVAPAWNGVAQAVTGQHWLPLSQVEVIERAVGDFDGIRLPEWLLKKLAV